MAGKPFYYRECYHKGRLKIIFIHKPTVNGLKPAVSVVRIVGSSL